jgi:Type IV secretion system pilin
MKKVICTMLLILGLVAAMPASAGAVDVFQPCGNVNGVNGSNTVVCQDVKNNSGKNKNPIIDTLKAVLNILALLIGIAAVVTIIIGGIKFILSSGDPSGIKSARETIIYALVGVVVAVFARAVVAFVLNKL